MGFSLYARDSLIKGVQLTQIGLIVRPWHIACVESLVVAFPRPWLAATERVDRHDAGSRFHMHASDYMCRA